MREYTNQASHNQTIRVTRRDTNMMDYITAGFGCMLVVGLSDQGYFSGMTLGALPEKKDLVVGKAQKHTHMSSFITA